MYHWSTNLVYIDKWTNYITVTKNWLWDYETADTQEISGESYKTQVQNSDRTQILYNILKMRIVNQKKAKLG